MCLQIMMYRNMKLCTFQTFVVVSSTCLWICNFIISNIIVLVHEFCHEIKYCHISSYIKNKSCTIFSRTKIIYFLISFSKNIFSLLLQFYLVLFILFFQFIFCYISRTDWFWNSKPFLFNINNKLLQFLCVNFITIWIHIVMLVNLKSYSSCHTNTTHMQTQLYNYISIWIILISIII